MRTLCFDFFLAWVITTLVLHGYASNAAVKQKIAEDLLRKGYDCIQKGDYGCAIADFTKAIEIKPKFAEAYIGRGAAWHSKGDNDGYVALERGEILFDLSDYDCAIADFTKAIELNPKIAQAYDFRGDAWAQKGDIGQACTDWRRACEIGACIAFDYMKKRGRCK